MLRRCLFAVFHLPFSPQYQGIAFALCSGDKECVSESDGIPSRASSRNGELWSPTVSLDGKDLCNGLSVHTYKSHAKLRHRYKECILSVGQHHDLT